MPRRPTVNVTFGPPYPTFLRDLKQLTKLCPLPQDVDLDVEALKRNYGWFSPTKKGGQIQLACGHDAGCTQNTLIHEWAHAMVHHSSISDHQDHGPVWGTAYAQCYRAVVENRK